MGTRNNNMDPNATGNDGSIHFNGNNNDRYMSRNMGTNNKSNPNAIGNDRFDHFNGSPNKNTSLQHNKLQDLTSYQNQNTSLDPGINNTPAWMKNKDTPSKKSRIFTLSGSLLNVASAHNLRAMHLALDNGLPAAVLCFGTLVDDEIPFSCHLDSCAAISTVSFHLYQWIITQHPHLVNNYEQFDNINPFGPITLDCAVPQSEAKKTTGKLTAVVTYKTRYMDNKRNGLKLSFGLGVAI